MIHDHFDGYYHCIECGGPCRLTGAERALTEMIRWRLARDPWLSIMERETIERVGGVPEALIARARATRKVAA